MVHPMALHLAGQEINKLSHNDYFFPPMLNLLTSRNHCQGNNRAEPELAEHISPIIVQGF